jgi:hypothetical protein
MFNALFVKSKLASLLMQTQFSTQYSLLENFTGFLVDCCCLIFSCALMLIKTQ